MLAPELFFFSFSLNKSSQSASFWCDWHFIWLPFIGGAADEGLVGKLDGQEGAAGAVQRRHQQRPGRLPHQLASATPGCSRQRCSQHWGHLLSPQGRCIVFFVFCGIRLVYSKTDVVIVYVLGAVFYICVLFFWLFVCDIFFLFLSFNLHILPH